MNAANDENQMNQEKTPGGSHIRKGDAYVAMRNARKYAAANARGATSHVAAHTRTKGKKRRQLEQILQENAHRNADEVTIRPLLHYGQEKRERNTKKHRRPECFHDSDRAAITGSSSANRRNKTDPMRRRLRPTNEEHGTQEAKPRRTRPRTSQRSK